MAAGEVARGLEDAMTRRKETTLAALLGVLLLGVGAWGGVRWAVYEVDGERWVRAQAPEVCPQGKKWCTGCVRAVLP